MLDAATEYAARGWPSFPLELKKPRIRDWPNAASTDLEQIREWWTRWPEADVAIVTGRRSGVVAIDLDDDEVGGDAYGALLCEHGAPGSKDVPDGASIRTGRDGGGWRLLFALPPGAEVRKGVLAPGVEFMGEGGSAIMPPSLHKTGRRYVWADPIPAGGLPVLSPAWVALMAYRPPAPRVAAPRPVTFDGVGTPYGLAALREEVALLGQAEEGTRNHRLNRAAFAVGSLVAAGHLDVEAALTELIRVATDIGLREDEIQATIRSGLDAGLRSPRAAA